MVVLRMPLKSLIAEMGQSLPRKCLFLLVSLFTIQRGSWVMMSDNSVSARIIKALSVSA